MTRADVTMMAPEVFDSMASIGNADESPELESLAALPRPHHHVNNPTYRVVKLAPGYDPGAFDSGEPTYNDWLAQLVSTCKPLAGVLPTKPTVAEKLGAGLQHALRWTKRSRNLSASDAAPSSRLRSPARRSTSSTTTR